MEEGEGEKKKEKLPLERRVSLGLKSALLAVLQVVVLVPIKGSFEPLNYFLHLM
jgi:hypothetical protein